MDWTHMNRREAMRLAAMVMVSGGVALPKTARAAGGTVNFADIGVGDPGGDWSKYTAASGYNVNLVSIGNAPSAILNVLVASGGQGTYDIINIVGGMQKPLVENDLVEKIDTSRMPNWAKDTYIDEFLGKGKPGFQFIGFNDEIYGVPDRAAGRFIRLPAGEDRQARFLCRAVRSAVERLCGARGQLHHRRAENGALSEEGGSCQDRAIPTT